MRFKLSSLLILLTAACFLLTAIVTLIHAGPDHHYEIGISLLGSIIAAVFLVLLLASDEKRAKDADANGD
jgi:ABC-type enterochelin transport system permease subunit